MLFDNKTDFGARVALRLAQERIIWLVTVSESLMPQPSPVWFLWVDENFLIYSRPDQAKLRNIARHPKVALHFEGDGRGGDIVIFTGEAELDAPVLPADQVPAYVEKYQPGFERIGTTAARFAQDYSVPILVRPTGIRGH